MTNNIEKLYELANAFTTYTVQGGDTYKVTRFTPEKQLELIKLMSNFKVYEIVKHNGRNWFMCASLGCDDYHEARHEQFEQALSSLIIQLWNDLTEQQRNEVKEILK